MELSKKGQLFKKWVRDPFLKKILSFSELEIQLRDISKVTNRNKVKGWHIKNILIPVGIILIPYLISFLLPYIEITFYEVFFNGSLTILGVSLLYSMASHLVRTKVDFEENLSVANEKKKIFEGLSSLRDKLLGYVTLLVIISLVLYFIQIIDGNIKIPDNEENLFEINGYLIGISTVFVFIVCMYLGKLIFEVSDDFIGEAMAYDSLFKSVQKQEEETMSLLEELEQSL